VPVEKIVEVEKFIEKIVEVPVEKIIEKTVEVEKIVIDDARIKELEGLLAEERRHTAELQSRIDESSKSASDQALKFSEREAKMTSAIKEAVDRENKYVEQIRHLEDELRRLPQAASEVADIQAAVFKIMTDETAEIGELMELEKREFEEAKRRFEERSDRLLMRKREMLKRSGANMVEMTHKALLARPEDPRTSQLRRELEELRRTHEHAMLDNEMKVRELTDELRIAKVEGSRIQEGMKDITQLRNEVQHLKEQLQLREKELLEERQHGEHQRQMQASHNQALMARLASLESTSIGTVDSISTNQSRESKQVKLPGWMRFGR
jgi:chromosome segregation ATPase